MCSSMRFTVSNPHVYMCMSIALLYEYVTALSYCIAVFCSILWYRWFLTYHDLSLSASNISGLVLPTSVVEISDYAFSSCSSMGGLLTVPTYVGLLPFIPAWWWWWPCIRIRFYLGQRRSWGSMRFMVRVSQVDNGTNTYLQGAILFCTLEILATALTELILPTSLARVSDNCFAQCSSLRSLTIPTYARIRAHINSATSYLPLLKYININNRHYYFVVLSIQFYT